MRTTSLLARPGSSDAVDVRRVLAVDDSPPYLSLLADSLSEDGYAVRLAGSGQQALDILADDLVDCILLDLMMPGLSGEETCRRIKATPVLRDIPVVMLTAIDDRDAIIRGLAAGADDYISKASDLEVLKARVRAQVRRKAAADENRRMREELLEKALEAAEDRAARRIAEARAELVDELERKNRELEAFSYSVSHDLRGPLRAISAFSHILTQEHGASLAPAAREHVDRISSAARRMGELIDDLIELARVGRSELRRVYVDLSRLARDIVRELQKRTHRDVDVVLPETLFVEGDWRLMRVALENLLGNAWKFTARTPHARIELGRTERGGDPVVFVRDNGAGFDMARAARLFSPFQRLHGDAEFAGTGIGLATVRRIIERHGGRIWADASPGQGATFFFTLPPAPHGVVA